jgi:Tol biopolymer transport system component
MLAACLEKDPNKRLRDVGDVWRLVDEPHADRPAASPTTSRAHWPKYVVVAGALLLLGLIPANLIHWRETPPVRDIVRFQISAPEKSRFLNYLALSPDGRKIVFQAHSEDGKNYLYVRSLDAFDPRIIADAQGTAFAFWSPDSRYVAYQAGTKLRKVEVSGGPPQDICNVPATIVGGAWSPHGVIVFGNAAGSPLRGLFKVSANGGTPSQLTALDASKKDAAHILPAFLPDGRHFLYVRFSLTSTDGGTYIGSIDELPEKQPDKMLIPNSATILFSPMLGGSAASGIGYLMYLRETTLIAQAFNTRTLELAGDAMPAASPVSRSANEAIGVFSVSQTGTLIYRTDNEEGTNQITWLGRDGKPLYNPDTSGTLTTVAGQGIYTELNLSPNMQSAVIAAGGVARRDIYLLDLARKINSRFTFDPADDRSPVWSYDGQQVVFSSNRDGQGDLYIKTSNGARNEELLYKSTEPKTANDWSRDGRFLLFTVSDPKTKNDIWYMTMAGERKAMPFLQNPYSEGSAQFSPDGRFVAYLSDESGTPEIYVRSFPDANGRWQISRGGGVDPRWSGDGKEIIYLSTGRVMAVEVASTPSFTPGIPRVLFEAPIVNAGSSARNPGYSVSADGKSFLVNLPLGPNASRPINVVVNWQSGLKR